METFSLIPKVEKEKDENDDDDDEVEENDQPIKFHSLLVPTIDTTRFSYLLEVLLKKH